MIFYDPLGVVTATLFLVFCVLLFYLFWYEYKSEKTINVIYTKLEELLSRNALRISAETSSNVTNKFIVAEFDKSYYIQHLKILLLGKSLGWFIRITADSDIRIPFSITMQQVSVIDSLINLSIDGLPTFFRKTFVVNYNNKDLYEKYFYKENMVMLFKSIGLFSKLQITPTKAPNSGTTFEIYIQRISVSSILSAIALFENLLRNASMETRYRIISNSLKNSLIPQSELV